MHIAVFYGSPHRGSTRHITQRVLAHLSGPGTTIEEFDLTQAMPQFCLGCFQCILNGEEHCPHRACTQPLQQALHRADVLIFATPVYAMRCSGQMKTFLDHFAYQFIVHRPDGSMFHKRALIITTAAGAGNKGAAGDIAASLKYWGVGGVSHYGKAVRASCWEHVSPGLQQKIEADCVRLAQSLRRPVKHPPMFARYFFLIMRQVMKKMPDSVDGTYWQAQGWLGDVRPWKEPKPK